MHWTRVSARRALAMAAVCGAAAASCSERLAAPVQRARSGEQALTSGASGASGGTLRLASLGDIRGLDPAGPIDAVAGEAINLLFAGLVELDENGDVTPDLAERWSIADGGRTYRFTLRRGVQMHDGSTMTADDVVRSVERALDPSTPNPNASYFADVDGVVAETPYEVTFRLKAPDATFLARLAMPSLRPTCKSAGRRYSDVWNPCGAGPFKLEPSGWRRGTSLRVIKHAGYFRPGLPHLDAVEWTYNVQVLAQRFRFEDGDLDVVRDLHEEGLSPFLQDARWQPYGEAERDTAIYGEAMNTRLPPFDDVEVRRAVAAAIDREHYRLLQPALVAPLTQVLPPDVLGYDPAFAGQRYDYAGALEHMKRAGLAYDPATGRGGWPELVPYLLYDQGAVVYTAQLLQQDLAKIGIRLRLQQVSYSAFLAMQTDPTRPGMSFAGWGMDYDDPSTFFDPLFASPTPGASATNSSSFYSNPHLDDLLVRARATLDSGPRARLYAEANAIVCDDAPWAFTFLWHFYDIRQPYVHGLTRHPVLGRNVSRVWLDAPGPP
jgi:ABC-type transport system substrate-binding protein